MPEKLIRHHERVSSRPLTHAGVRIESAALQAEALFQRNARGWQHAPLDQLTVAIAEGDFKDLPEADGIGE